MSTPPSDAETGSNWSLTTRAGDNDELTPEAVSSRGYKVLEELGGGGFSSVHHATHTDPKTKKVTHLAVKVIRFDKVPEGWKDKQLPEELKIAKKLKHGNIIEV